MILHEKKPVIILGAGGHAKVVADTLICLGWEIEGFVTPDLKVGDQYFGRQVLGDDGCIFDYQPSQIVLANGIGALPGKKLRWALGEKMRDQGYNFVTFAHPTAVIADDVILHDGAQIMAGAILQPGVEIGVDSIVNTGAILDHDCHISTHCHVAPGVVCSGNVSLGKGSHLGTGCSIIQDIFIGDGSVVAAGSVVYKDLPTHSKFITQPIEG